MHEQLLFSRRRIAAALPLAGLALPGFGTGHNADAQLLALGSELEAVHAARAAFELAEPDADHDPFYEPHWEIREAINRIPATTITGLAVKGRAAQMAFHHDPSNECEGDGALRDLSLSLIDDLLEMLKQGSLA